MRTSVVCPEITESLSRIVFLGLYLKGFFKCLYLGLIIIFYSGIMCWLLSASQYRIKYFLCILLKQLLIVHFHFRVNLSSLVCDSLLLHCAYHCSCVTSKVMILISIAKWKWFCLYEAWGNAELLEINELNQYQISTTYMQVMRQNFFKQTTC